jgi:hypothetical protein
VLQPKFYGVISVLLLSATAAAFSGDRVSYFLSLAAYSPFTHVTQALHRQQTGFRMYLPTRLNAQARGHPLYGS